MRMLLQKRGRSSTKHTPDIADRPRPSLRPDAPPKGDVLRTSGFDGAETDVLALGYRA